MENLLSQTGESTIRSTPQIANGVIIEYLIKNEPIFHSLSQLRAKGWNNPDGDKYYKEKREKADNAGTKGRMVLHKMSKQIATQMHFLTRAYAFTKPDVAALFVCMAPGGYTETFLSMNPHAQICGLTLPEQDGGHPMILPYGSADPRVHVEFLDVTMLASEFCDNVYLLPVRRLGEAEFLKCRPFEGETFDFVLCDGQVLRTHKRHESRDLTEATRLTTAQLIFGLQRIKPGGEFIILLHKVEALDTVRLLCDFSHFSTIQLFKPKPMHSQRSSFYLVAHNVDPTHSKAIEAIKRWKQAWWYATFGELKQQEWRWAAGAEHDAMKLLDDFGEQLRALGRPIWDIQREALEKAFYTR